MRFRKFLKPYKNKGFEFPRVHNSTRRLNGMIEMNNNDKFLNYYLKHLFVFGELQVGEIRSMIRFKGQGSEYVQCSFDEEDEDYMKGM